MCRQGISEFLGASAPVSHGRNIPGLAHTENRVSKDWVKIEPFEWPLHHGYQDDNVSKAINGGHVEIHLF